MEIENNKNEKLKEGFKAFQDNEYEKAIECMLPLAEEGYVIAQCMVAGLYHLGLGIKADAEKARKLYEQAGQQGCGLAYNNLASTILGEENDVALAQHYYRKAIENGFDMITESWIASLN
jgi:TPR repeat protein